MGDFYRFTDLAGVPYLEYSNENSGWNCIAVQLTEEQFEIINDYLTEEDDKKNEFFKSFLTNIKEKE